MFGLFKRMKSIESSQLDTLNKKEFTLLDVRSKEEYESGHIPYAKNVPLEMLKDYTPKDNKDLYVICQGGVRSRKAVNILRKRDISATNVNGGMLRWKGSIQVGK